MGLTEAKTASVQDDKKGEAIVEVDSNLRVYLAQCEVFVLLFSLASRASFDNAAVYARALRAALRDLKNNTMRPGPERPLLLVGTHADAEDGEQKVTATEAAELAATLCAAAYLPVSATTRAGLTELQHAVCRAKAGTLPGAKFGVKAKKGPCAIQ